MQRLHEFVLLPYSLVPLPCLCFSHWGPQRGCRRDEGKGRAGWSWLGAHPCLVQRQHVEGWEQLIAASLCSPSPPVGTRLCLSSGEKVAERRREQSPISALGGSGSRLAWRKPLRRPRGRQDLECARAAVKRGRLSPAASPGWLGDTAVGERLRLLPLYVLLFPLVLYFCAQRLTAVVYKSDTLVAFNEQHNRCDLSTRNTLYAVTEPPARRSDNSSCRCSYPRWRQSRNYELFPEFTKSNGCRYCNNNTWSWKQYIKQKSLFKEGSYKTALSSFIIRQLFRIHVPFKIIKYIQNSSLQCII